MNVYESGHIADGVRVDDFVSASHLFNVLSAGRDRDLMAFLNRSLRVVMGGRPLS